MITKVLVGIVFGMLAATANAQSVSLIGEIRFDQFKALPSRLDGASKAILDDVAAVLKRDPTVTVVLVGNATTLEMNNKSRGYSPDLAARRANNTKTYLVTQQGIDPSRIEARVGRKGSTVVAAYIVPPNAQFEAVVPDTSPAVLGHK